MHKLFTFEDLVRYAYDEMSPEEAAEFRAELNECPEMKMELALINEGKNLVGRQQEPAPSPGTIRNILNYSKALSINKGSATGIACEMILN